MASTPTHRPARARGARFLLRTQHVNTNRSRYTKLRRVEASTPSPRCRRETTPTAPTTTSRTGPIPPMQRRARFRQPAWPRGRLRMASMAWTGTAAASREGNLGGNSFSSPPLDWPSGCAAASPSSGRGTRPRPIRPVACTTRAASAFRPESTCTAFSTRSTSTWWTRPDCGGCAASCYRGRGSPSRAPRTTESLCR